MHGSNRGMIERNEAPPPLDLTPEEVAALAEELGHDQAAVAELYDRKAQAQWGYTYLPGLLRPSERTSSAPMALAWEGGDVQAMHPWMGQGQWQEEAWLRQHGSLLDERRGEADGVGSVDGADVPQHGEHAVGVARQWGGRVGQVETCHAGVCAAYASRQGSMRLERRLSLPDAWFDAAHRARWRTGGVPEATLFQTKPTVARERWRAVVQAGTVRCRWVTCEEALGREPTCLDGVAALQRWDGADMPPDTRLWLRRPPTAVPTWSGRGRRPRTLRLLPGAPPPQRGDPRAAAWPIETAFEERKGGLGVDHDEVRSGWGWQQQMTLCLWAHHGLVWARLRVHKGRQR